MNVAIGNFFPCEHQRDDKKREKKRERGEKRETKIAQRKIEEREKGAAEEPVSGCFSLSLLISFISG